MVALFPTPSPSLPEFTSLCVTGPYALPMPLNACIDAFQEDLRSESSNRPALLVTSSTREKLLADFVAYNDEWLSNHSGAGRLSRALSNVVIVSCPTIARFLAFLSSLHVSEASAGMSTASVRVTPSLVVLHEPAALLRLGSHQSDATLSTYCGLIISALSACSSLSTPSFFTKLVLFDSSLDHLKLPILRPSLELGNSQGELRQALPVVLKYFDYHADCQDIASERTFEDVEGSQIRRMSVVRAQDYGVTLGLRAVLELVWTETRTENRVPWASSDHTRVNIISTEGGR